MKILFLNYEYPPLGGGAANATAYLLRAYEHHPDMVVDLVTSSPDDKYQVTALTDTITVHAIPIGKNGKNLHYQSQKDLLVYSYKAYKFADRLLQQKEYDVIHAFFGIPCGALALRLGKKYSLPYIVSLRGSDVPGYSERFSFLYIFLTSFIRKIWKRAAVVVSNSEGLKALALQSAPEQAVQVIPNGIDTEKFFPADLTTLPEEWIITAGATRLTARKGLHLIIQALPELLAIHPSIIFEVMGDGESLQELQGLAKELGIAERVRFLGRLPAAETYQYYQRARVFVLPSANEGMSNALLEALASGLPAVVTDTGGSQELVTNGKNGFIIKREKEEIVEALTKLIRDESLRVQMGQASRERALTQSWEAVANQYVEIYQHVNTQKV